MRIIQLGNIQGAPQYASNFSTVKYDIYLLGNVRIVLYSFSCEPIVMKDPLFLTFLNVVCSFKTYQFQFG